jgi:hypothetical protein
VGSGAAEARESGGVEGERGRRGRGTAAEETSGGGERSGGAEGQRRRRRAAVGAEWRTPRRAAGRMDRERRASVRTIIEER